MYARKFDCIINKKLHFSKVGHLYPNELVPQKQNLSY